MDLTMKSFLLLLLTISLATSVAGQCCFSLIAQGSVNGIVGEDSLGGNCIGGTPPPPSAYCVSNASFTDLNGQLCSILSSNGQFVCGNNASGDATFTLADNLDLLHDGSPNYFACPGNNGSFNIFSDSIATSSGCTNITILTGGYNCSALGRPPSPAPSTSPIAPSMTPAMTPTTPMNLSCTGPGVSGNGTIAPNLITFVSSAAPDTAFGTQTNATITTQITTVFTFDIPASYNGTCALMFQFPYADQAEFPYNFSGIEEEVLSHGGLNFTLLQNPVGANVTFNSLPPVQVDYGKVQVIPGNNYTIAVGPCGMGQNVSYEVASVGGVLLEYFESLAASPLGVFVVPCQ